MTRLPASITPITSDWLHFAASLEPGSVDLLYVDPPFNTGRPQTGGRRGVGDEGGTDARQASLMGGARLGYEDAWPSTDAWARWLRDRLEATLPALKPTASILLHIDWRTSHHARLLLDDLLGEDRFVNHLVWSYGLGGSSPRRFARKHDDILFYCIDPDRYFFEPPMVPASSRRMEGQMKKATDVLDIPSLNNMASERTGYPTQKPVALLDLLIRACCPPGGVVLDPCCGSGTTVVAAVAAGCRALACDQNPDAVAITVDRLQRMTSCPSM